MRLKAQRSCALGALRESGQAKVRAEVRPGAEILKSPLTGRECVFYFVDVAEWNNGSKTPLLEEASTTRFRMDDSTGSVLVDPSQAKLLLRARRVRGHSSDYLGQHRTLLRRHGLGMVDDYGELRSLAFCETIVAPGDQITALGSIRFVADPQGMASYREQPQSRILGSEPRLPLLLSDAA
jgi:hypothetical protein